MVIMLSSATTGEGKSFVTANLGATIAFTGKKVILIGADLRKPKLKRYFLNESPKVGLANYLVGESSLDDIIMQHAETKVDFIPAGPIPPNPSELLHSFRLQEMVDMLKANYDYIIFDTPPVGLVADPFMINELVDMTILVIRYHFTNLKALDQLSSLVDDGRIKRPALVLNGIKRSSIYRYGNYYGDGYSYGSGYYEEPERTIWKRLISFSKN